MIVLNDELSPFERFLKIFTKIRPGEGRTVALFFLQGFLILFSYYIVRSLREGFILSEMDAAARSYAVAVVAGLLIFIVPLYSAVRRRIDPARLVPWISAFFVMNLGVFYILWNLEIQFGFIFFVWVGLYGPLVISQFWSFAADTFNDLSGRRLFPVIMIGANLGALAGAEMAKIAVKTHGLHGLMLIGSLTLAITIFLGQPAKRAVPGGSLSGEKAEKPKANLFGGFAVVFKDQYLLLLALFIVLLNFVNTTGEFLFADLVSKHVEATLGAGAGLVAREELVTTIYADYMFWFTLVGLAIQVFLVSRIFRWIGVAGSVLVLPVVAFLGYGLMGFIPIFTIIRTVKILENAVDYSLMGTARQALFLPTSREAKYDAKTAIDTFFWRFGDLLQAGTVFIGIKWLGWGTRQFAFLSFGMALVWIGVGLLVIRQYRRLVGAENEKAGPAITAPLPECLYRPGEKMIHNLPASAFESSGAGDVLGLSAMIEGGGTLPIWLDFHQGRFAFKVDPPKDCRETVEVEVTATNVDGGASSQVLVFSPVA